MKTDMEVSYYPGCSLATTAKENNFSLIEFCESVGIRLVELDDWNCCGSSSAHSINAQQAMDLSTRVLSLADASRPLLVACPSCLLRLRHARHVLQNRKRARERYHDLWGKPFDADIDIVHFFELFEHEQLKMWKARLSQSLNGLSFAPYYGCMLAHPPALRSEDNYYGLLEKTLTDLGATPMEWMYHSRCCGTFLSVVKPRQVTSMVNTIISDAARSGAECIVTACAMCHMNLEIRCTVKEKVPILHFSEVLSLALGKADSRDWFSRHLIDPRPLLQSKGFIS